MSIGRYFKPASTILASDPEARALLLISLVMFLFCRVLLLWGFHNLYHLTYLLIGFTFFPVIIMSMQITRNMGHIEMMTKLTVEEHRALRRSSIILGYTWPVLLYSFVGVVGIVDFQQAQAGVGWPVSTYVPDLISFAVIVSFCVCYFALVIVALHWLWDSFELKYENETLLVLDEDEFKSRGGLIFFSLFFIFCLLLVFKASIEGELNLTQVLPWLGHLFIGMMTIVFMVALISYFWYKNKKVCGTYS